MTTTGPDMVSRWLALALCVTMIGIGCWGIFVPHSLRKGIVDFSNRLPDQSRVAPFVKFMTEKHFILFLRIFSLFPIALAISLFCTVVR